MKGRVGILVTPWLDTAVPMYCVEIGLGLRAEGIQPVFLCDFGQLAYNDVAPKAIRDLTEFAAQLAEFGEVVMVESESATAAPPEGWDRLIDENAIWTTKGEELAASFVESRPELRGLYEKHASRVMTALKRVALDWLLIPGGVFGVSGLYLRSASELGLDFTTFDSAVGGLMAAHRGAAAHHSDVPRALDLLREEIASTPESRTRILEEVGRAARDQRESRDQFQCQTVAPTGHSEYPSDLLLCLNYRADTAALCRTRAFPSVKAWLVAVLDYAEKRGDLRVNVRPHPITRLSRLRSTDRLQELVRERDPEGRFSRWIAADAPVNSYDLMNSTRVVLPFTSTVGIEAAFLGKPVVVGTQVFYESLGFVHAANTPEEYFALIERGLSGGLQVMDEQREQAALTLYLALKCRSLRTYFTPNPPDFLKWIEQTPGELWSVRELRDLREALLSRQPVMWFRHRQLAEAAVAAP